MKLPGPLTEPITQDKTKKNLSQHLVGNESTFHMLYLHALSRNGFWVTFNQNNETVRHKVNLLIPIN